MNRGGYRTGAGRPATHSKTTVHLRLDVRDLARRGLLSAGTSFAWSWWRSGELAGRVDVCIMGGCAVHLDYRRADRPEHVELALDYTACNFGSDRPWFTCPRCTRRVAVVYLASVVGCRQCLRLRYPSQSADALGRSWQRSKRIAAKLRIESGHYPRRPKGMRHATFDRLAQAWWAEDGYREDAFDAFAERWAAYLR